MSDKNTLMQEIEAVVGEVQELLKKSGIPLHKDDSEELTPPADDMGAAPAPGPEAPAPDAMADQAAMAPEAGAPDAAGGELEQVSEEPEADLAAEAQGLSDEELDNLLEVLMAEKQSRSNPEQAEAPMEAPAGAPAPAAPEMAEKSMKEDFSKMTKSLDTVMGAVEALAKKVDLIASKPASQPAKVSVKAPAANAQDVQVMHKSTPIAKRLNKSETIEFAQRLQKSGSKLIDRDMVWSINNAKSDEELHAVQDQMAKKGVELPKL